MVNSISKTEFLKLIEENLPDDARIVATSEGEFYEINDYIINQTIIPFDMAFDPEDIDEEDKPNATHLLVGN